jgi:hypothetical protein
MDEALECVDHLACMVDHWRAMLGEGGSLRIYVD